MADWLAAELGKQLRGVEAPAELWQRVVNPQQADNLDRKGFRLGPILAFASAVAILMLAVPRSPSIRTRDAAELNRWMREEARIDLPIPVGTRDCVRGARIMEQNGVKFAEIGFKIGDRDSTVLIARAGSTHDSQWKQHGGSYLISGGCKLCHADL